MARYLNDKTDIAIKVHQNNEGIFDINFYYLGGNYNLFYDVFQMFQSELSE